jgi:PIN domain nuclease of toxin-antitoxin system
VSYLVDTHALLWHSREPERLGRHARAILGDASIPVWFSIVSIWEIAIKSSLGKLRLDATVEEFARAQLRNAYQLLPLDIAHVAQVAKLPLHHRDPFDRMLIAQAMSENFTLITADESFRKYRGLKRVW